MPKFKLMAVQEKVLRYLGTRRAAEATWLTQHGGVPTRTFEASRLIGYLLEVRGQRPRLSSFLVFYSSDGPRYNHYALHPMAHDV